MTGTVTFAAEIDEEIVTIEENLRVLMDEDAALSGIVTHDLISQQIDELQTELNRLRKIREQL